MLPTEIVARIVAERDAGSSLRVIADGLTRDRIPTARGGQHWHASAIQAVLRSLQANELRGTMPTAKRRTRRNSKSTAGQDPISTEHTAAQRN